MFALVVFGLVSLEQSAQQKSRNDLATRFSVRGATAASFVQSYTGFVLGRETTLAEQSLSGPVVSDGTFRDFLQDFDFGPAVLLDSAGNTLDVAPAAPSLIGTQIGSKYKHLSSAFRGTAAVSNIVPSVAQRVPIVTFAAPFNTRYGRRVVSGAFDLVTQPMGLYMHHVLPYVDSAVYLVDATGKIIVGSTKATGSLAQVDPALSRSLAHGDSGIYKPKSGVPTQFAGRARDRHSVAIGARRVALDAVLADQREQPRAPVGVPEPRSRWRRARCWCCSCATVKRVHSRHTTRAPIR